MLEVINKLGLYSQSLSALAYIVGIIGFIPAVVTFIQKTYRDIKEKEEKIFNDIAAEYFRINEILFYHPELGASWFQHRPTRQLTEEEKIKQTILFDMLTALFEKTYIAYQHASARQRKSQWEGWHQFIEDYCQKEDYRSWWKMATQHSRAALGAQFDNRFERYMGSLFEKHQ